MNTYTLHEASLLWKATGMSVPDTAQRATALLNQAGIPTLITGGLAVQVHGYPRLTVDADIIVPDIMAAHQVLINHGYRQSFRVPTDVIDPESEVRVDLLPGGSRLTPRCPVDFPMPSEAAYVFVLLPDLISIKLGSFMASPARRARDRADVVELILRNKLERSLAGIHPAVQSLYWEIWDAIEAEPEGPAS